LGELVIKPKKIVDTDHPPLSLIPVICVSM